MAVLHEFEEIDISYDKFMAELNKVKARLPKEQWHKISFDFKEGHELGTYDPYIHIRIKGPKPC